MNTDKKRHFFVICVYLCSSVVLVSSGCAKPNAANIALRKENQKLRDEISDLKRLHDADLAMIVGLQSHATTVSSLPTDRLGQLFTVHGLEFGRLTGGMDSDPQQPGDEGLQIYVVPTDAKHDTLKAAGSFVVEAFDLANGDARVGKWEFPLDQADKEWYGQGLLYTYVLKCPWQHGPPAHTELTIKVTFMDGLTGRVFERQKVVKIHLPPATSPAQ